MHIVLDASAAVEFLVGTATGVTAARILIVAESVHAPDLIVPETLSVLRSLVLREEISSDRAAAAARDLHDLTLEVWPSMPLADSAWTLRGQFTVYDAMYVALARALDQATLLTCDRRLARGVRTATDIDVIDLGHDDRAE
ncbi:MAG TPA: type II toxin-antitoxin system VapC family toxin [Microthrixaceae bacterium]|nr:type II toxin-antitoxin system VapC family toxin [Microthrixaceae bacterium]